MQIDPGNEGEMKEGEAGGGVEHVQNLVTNGTAGN